VNHYEELRGSVLEDRIASVRLGLSVLLRQGLAAWMTAWSQCTVTDVRTAKEPPRTKPSPWEETPGELIQILTNMAMHLVPRRIA